VHGLGLESVKKLTKGQKVCFYASYEDDTYKWNELFPMPSFQGVPLHDTYDCANELDPNKVIRPSLRSPGRFANAHSSMAGNNVDVRKQGKQLWLVATKDVPKGQELFWPYN
jgi:hypothetical protein